MDNTLEQNLTWPEIESRYYNAKERLKFTQDEYEKAQDEYTQICNIFGELFDKIWPGKVD